MEKNNSRGEFGSAIRQRVDCGEASPERCKVSPACSWHTRELMGRELDLVREIRDDYKADMVKAQDLLWQLAAVVWKTPESDIERLTDSQCKGRMVEIARLLRAYGPERE